MKTIAIIQARLGATRLPGKMLMDIAGQPAIAWVVDRIKLSKRIDEVWLATTDTPADDALAEWANAHTTYLFRGSENDVLDRYYQTARQAGADVVVRVPGDCPFSDFQIIDRAIEEFQREGAYDYASNHHPPTFPDGLDVEVVSFAALERTWKEAKLASEREHVTPYIWKHADQFRLYNVTHDTDLSAERWTLDNAEDLEFLRRVAEEINKRSEFVGFKEILKIVGDHPEWRAINAHLERNAGYKKSLAQDSYAQNDNK